MDARLVSEIQDTQKSLLDTYELILQYGDEESKNPKQFLDIMEDLCKLKNDGTAQESALVETKESTSDFQEYKKNYETKQAKIKSQPKRSAEYKNFAERIMTMKNRFQPEADSGCEGEEESGGINADRDQHFESEDLVMESQINRIDPLTKKPMVEPMRNNICGHHYEKTSILEAIRINPRLRCPVAGCGNKNFVRPENLSIDDAFRMRLRNVATEHNSDSDEDLL